MSDVTRLPNHAHPGDPVVAGELLPLVYQELRNLAVLKMAGEAAGHTLQPTALVHEAWLRMAGEGREHWECRAQFFSAAAEAMRRILIDRVRRRLAFKRGNGVEHEVLEDEDVSLAAPSEEILAVHEALDRLAADDALAADLVKLRYFVGMTMPEAAEALGVTLRKAERLWTFARAWLRNEFEGAPP